MSFDLQRILESKRALRQRLAARPLTEKLRMLDALRERTVAIRKASAESKGRFPTGHRETALGAGTGRE